MENKVEREPNILVVIAPTDGVPYAKIIPNELEPMQEIVGGYIETLTVGECGETSVVLICDEEGLLKGKKPNRFSPPHNQIVGDFIVTVASGEDFASMKPEETDLMMRILNAWAVSRVYDLH